MSIVDIFGKDEPINYNIGAVTEGISAFEVPKPILESVDFAEMIRAFYNRPPSLKYPWVGLNNLTKIDAGSITTMIAGTSHGKTTVALNLTLHFLQQGKRVLFWSGEMPEEILTMKLFGLYNSLPYAVLSGLEDDFISPSPDFAEKIKEFSLLCENLHIACGYKTKGVEDLLQIAREIQPNVILVDYIQQLKNGNKYRTRDEEIEAVMDELNVFAIQTAIPILNFAQINRESRNVEKPNLTCIRHSATIEQYSANVIGIWNASMANYLPNTSPTALTEGWYWWDSQETGNAVAVAQGIDKVLMELIILKSRYHGNVGKAVPTLFNPPSGRIESFPVNTPVPVPFY